MPSSSPSSTQPPAIRTFQMDGSTQGDLASSVNLFRGDVNLTQNLFTLPGRSADGLDVSIAIQYQSNVFREATTRNAEAPTGTLGLGWALPLTWIEAEAGASPVAAARRYVLNDNGSPNQLFRQPLVPPLFSVSGGLAAGLVDGAIVPAALRDEFRGRGLALSSGSRVRGAGPWTVEDDALMQSFSLGLEGSALVVRDGGELYQLQNYQFWKVLYYPAYERWLVIGESGVRRAFGGRTADTSLGFSTSVGNSVAWSVYWSDGAGRPTWSGPCEATAGQVQVARAWYLSEVRDRFGSAVRYSYNAGARGPAGVIPGVEQQVGVGGKPYTKAVYLDTITDSFGRTVRFQYAEKLWSAATTAPREYVDPHRATPSEAPGPYQDRYETRYLTTIDVCAATGRRMYSFEFEYAPRPLVNGKAKAVANMTGYTGALQGDTYKRLLTAVTQIDQDGVAAPGLRFTYDLAPATAGGQPGALLDVTRPRGGRARYTYVRQDLSLCDRTLTAVRPAGVPAGATSRVFYGDDHVVVCFYNQGTLQLSVEVYTWTGRWIRWAPQSNALIDTRGLQLSSLVVTARADFLAVSFNRPGGEMPIYVYERDAARPGQWRPSRIDGVATAQDRPTLTIPSQGAQVELHAGDTFLVVSRMDPGTLSGAYDLLTWRWTTRSWTRSSVAGLKSGWITAGAEWFAVLDTEGDLDLAYLDGALTWRRATSLRIHALATTNLASLRLVPGQGMLVAALRTVGNTQQNTYNLTIAEWSADYTIRASSFGPFTDVFGAGNNPLGWTPVVVDDTLVGVNGNLLRRTGGTWSVDTSLNLGASPPGYTDQRFAYGPDVAVRVTAPSRGTGAAQAVVVAYDPGASPAWRGPAAISETLPNQSRVSDNWPSAGGDWLIVGPYLWSRGAATDWTQRVSQPASVNLTPLIPNGATFSSASVVDATPGFVAFSVDQGGTQSAQAVTLRNGAFDASVAFADERLYVPTSGAPGGPGVSPAGPRLFAAFPASSGNLDLAQSVIIHRHAGDAVRGPIAHYTVQRVEMDDGFGARSSTRYEPDPASAAADASGQIVKFYANTLLPGSAAPGSAPYGRVVHRFLNGAADLTGGNFYDMLDGLLAATETYRADGALVESTRTTWAVYTKVASSPVDPAAPPVQLRGGWVVQSNEERVQDGVSRAELSSFTPPGFADPVTGQVVTKMRTNTGGDGATEAFLETTHHAVRFYPALWAIHALADVAQVDHIHRVGGVQTLVASTASTYLAWPSDAGEGVRTPAPSAGFSLSATNSSAFPFNTWTPGQTPAGWTLSTRTTARAGDGQETECVDGLGVSAATIYGIGGEMPVASVANAALCECAYLGFESYESKAGWKLTNVAYDETIAFSGQRSAVLAAGGASTISVNVTPTRADTWLVGCRYRTPTGFTPDASGLKAKVALGGGATKTVSLAWAATDGAWTYATLPVPVDSVAGGAGAITLTVKNTANTQVYVDSILITPLVTAATVRTFDPDSQEVRSAMDAGGRASRTFYDRAHRPVVSVGADGLVREVSASFLSRAGSATDQFHPDSPNAELTLHSAAGGVLEAFRDGDLWSRRWKPPRAADWSLSDGALVHASAAASELTWATQPSGTYAIYFEPQTSDPAAAIAISAGDVQLRWSSGGWSAQQAGVAWGKLGASNRAATHWLLVVGDGVVCFFGDGQLLFSRAARPAGGAPTRVALSVAGAVRLRNLTGVEDIRLGLSHNDAGGRQRQVHQLRGADSLVCALVFDPLDRQIATTKNAPGSFGSGGARPPLAYRPGFLDIPAFLSATTSSWEMRGDVADYHRGQLEGGIRRSDDGNYPYSGARYEASPRGVKDEIGLAGKESAINLLLDSKQRRTVQFSRGANASALGSLPAGQYVESRTTTPIKTTTTQWTDKSGRPVAALFADPSGAVVSQSGSVRTYAAPASGPTMTTAQQLPNARIPGPQRGDAAFVRTHVADSREQTARLADVDTGTTQFIYDSAGNLRFVQPAMGPGEQWYVFYRRDALGRVVAEGTVTGPWDPATLRARADVLAWPADGDPGVRVTIATEYDGKGKDPTLIGMKWRTTAANPAPASLGGAEDVTVVETFAYDLAGTIAKITQSVSGAVTASGTIGYAYNALGEITRVDLPAGCPFASIHYTYDDHGDVVAVGKTAGGAEFGAFGYDAERRPASWKVPDWSRSIEYTSQGWARSMVARSTAGDQSLALEFTYQADGAVDARKARYGFKNYASDYNDTFTYDGRRRLTGALGSSDSRYTSYDPNGNLWSSTRGGKSSSFPCADGTNRPQSASVEEAPASPLLWNARGQLLSGLGRSLDYQPGTGRTRAVTTASARLSLAYGGAHQRVVKRNVTSGSASVYFLGAGQKPVATLVNGAWCVTVQGPLGVIAYVSDRTYYPLSDSTHSVWGVLADGALVGARAWTPFGTPGASFGAPTRVPYGFHGHEWDDEVGLLHCSARLYDPALCRFLAPDPQAQFSSPYVFAGNNPLIFVDPTGELSTGARVGIGIGLAAIVVVGVAVVVCTAGAATPAVGAAAATAAQAGTAAATTGTVAATTGTAAATTGTVAVTTGAAAATSGAASAAAGAGLSAQVMAGISAAASSFSATTFGGTVAGSTLIGLGTGGMEYNIQHGRDFSWKGFGEAVGIGAASGFAGGAMGGTGALFCRGTTAALPGFRGALTRMGINAAQGVVSGGVNAGLNTMMLNGVEGNSWYDGVACSMALGASLGAMKGAARSGLKSAYGTRDPISQRVSAWKVVANHKTTNNGTMLLRAKVAKQADELVLTMAVEATFIAVGMGLGAGAQTF